MQALVHRGVRAVADEAMSSGSMLVNACRAVISPAPLNVWGREQTDGAAGRIASGCGGVPERRRKLLVLIVREPRSAWTPPTQSVRGDVASTSGSRPKDGVASAAAWRKQLSHVRGGGRVARVKH